MSDDKTEELREQVKIMQQTLSEVSHAQQNGPGWYTRGADGMYQQVYMWIGRGQEAINKVNKILDEQEPENV